MCKLRTLCCGVSRFCELTRQRQNVEKLHTDEVRHKIHYKACTINGGKRRWIYQLPQTIYSQNGEKLERSIDTLLKNKSLESLIATNDKGPVLKGSHPVATTSRYARGVSLNDGLRGRMDPAAYT